MFRKRLECQLVRLDLTGTRMRCAGRVHGVLVVAAACAVSTVRVLGSRPFVRPSRVTSCARNSLRQGFRNGAHRRGAAISHLVKFCELIHGSHEVQLLRLPKIVHNSGNYVDHVL